MYKSILSLLLVCSIAFTAAAQQSEYYSDIIALNRQCMLSQRVVKSYLAQHSLKDKNQALFIKGSFESFKLVQNELLEKSKNPAIIDKLKHMNTLWDVYSFFIEDDFDQDNATSTVEMSDKLTLVCNEVIELYKAEADSKLVSKKEIAFLGAIQEVGVLSTYANMAMVRLMSHCNKVGFEEVVKKQYADLKAGIENIVKDLKSFKYNSPNVNTKIDEFSSLTTSFFKDADVTISGAKFDEAALKKLLGDADYLSKSADELASMYEVLAIESTQN